MRRTLAFFLVFLHLTVLASPSWAQSELKHTVCPSGQGCDFTTLAAALSHMNSTHTDLTSGGSNEYALIEIKGDWTGVTDTSAATLSSIVTDATHDVHIYTIGDARHDGIYGHKATAYKLEVSEASGLGISSTHYVEVDGLQVQITSTTAASGYHGIKWVHNNSGTSVIKIHNNIVKGVHTGSASYVAGLYFYTGNATSSKTGYFWNNIVYDEVRGTMSTGFGVLVGDNGTPTACNVYVYNSTFQNDWRGIGVDGSGCNVYSYNDGFSSCNTPKDGGVGGGTGDSTSTPTFVDGGNDDFHLASSDTTWKDQTSDQSSGLFSDDIDDQTRTGSWDIGADEYVASAPSGQAIMYSSLFRNYWRR